MGKSTIAKILAKKLNANYYSMDQVLEKHKLDTIEGNGISAENFIRANEIIMQQAKDNNVIIIDGCFYRQEQISHLKKQCEHIQIFTLLASIDLCQQRNNQRRKPMSTEAITQVFNMTSSVKEGINIQTANKRKEDVVEEIYSLINL